MTMVEGDHNIEKEVHVATGQVLVEMDATNWSAAQREIPSTRCCIALVRDQEEG